MQKVGLFCLFVLPQTVLGAYGNYGAEWLEWIKQEAQQLLPRDTRAGRRSVRRDDLPAAPMAAPGPWPGLGGSGPRGGVELGPLNRTNHITTAFAISATDLARRLAPFAAPRAAAELNFDVKRDEREARIFKPGGNKMKREAYHLTHDHFKGGLWLLFAPTYPCVWTLGKYPARAGANQDGGKWLCGLAEMAASDRPCVVYSFGHAGDAYFESSISTAAKSCEVRTFDPTPPVPTLKFQAKWGIDAFHALGIDHGGGDTVSFVDGLGPVLGLREIMRRNGHERIDFLKIDVEGFEFCLIELLFPASSVCRPIVGQITMEVHSPIPQPAKYHYVSKEDGKRMVGQVDINSVRRVRRLWAVLERAGYRMVSLDPVIYPGSSQAEVTWIHKDWTPWGWLNVDGASTATRNCTVDKAWARRLDSWKRNMFRKTPVDEANDEKPSEFDILGSGTPDEEDDAVVKTVKSYGKRLVPCMALEGGGVGWGFEEVGN